MLRGKGIARRLRQYYHFCAKVVIALSLSRGRLNHGQPPHLP